MKQAKWKQQYRDKQNTGIEWKGSFSNFKYRIAMPAVDGSNRIWKQTMDMYDATVLNKSKIGTRTLLPQSANKTRQIKYDDKKFNRFSQKYSFFSTVAGTTTNNFKQQKAKRTQKTEQVSVIKRPLTGISAKKSNCSKEYAKPSGQVLYHRIHSAVERTPGWTLKRPISGHRQQVEILNCTQFQKNRERIQNIKNKVTSETQYSTPISRIGYNMQHEALFKYEHLELLSKGSEKKKFLPIQYAIKDLNIKTHHVYDSEKYHPITITIFSEFFHTNSETSREIRQQYLENWFRKVGKSYDPIKFASMYKQSNLSEQEIIIYESELKKIGSELLSPYNSQWIENAIIFLGKIQIHQEKLVCWIRQIWAFYEQAMKRAILNYQLLNYYERKRLHISCIPKRLSMMQKISKYGGYSIKLFDQHAFFVNIGRCRLEVNLWKYNILSLSLQKWFYGFKNIKLVETQAASFLASQGYSISLQKFIENQQLHFKQMQSVLRGIWFRGSAWIIFKQMLLQSSPINPWKEAIQTHSQNKRELFKQILLNHKIHNKWESGDIRGNEADSIYQQINVETKVKRISDNSIRLISIHTMELDQGGDKNLLLNDQMLKSISQLLNLQLYEIATNNINKLITLFQGDLLFELEPSTNLNTESIVIPYTCEQSIQSIKQIFQRIMQINYMSSGVFMQKQIKLNNSYLSIFNLKQQNKLKVQWKSYQAFKKLQQKVLTKIQESYLKAVDLLHPFLQFECLLNPKLFETKQQYSFEQFRSDIKILKDLRQKLNKLESRYEAGIFIVNTRRLHRQFKTKISDFFCLIQRKMRKQLTNDLLQLESDIGHSNLKVFQVNTTPQQLCENQKFLDEYQLSWSRLAKQKCKQMIRKTIQFELETDPQSTHKSGTFFKTKVSVLYKHLISFDSNIIQARSQKQKQRNDMQSLLHSTKIRILQQIFEQKSQYIESMQSYTYIPSKFKEYMEQVLMFRQYIRKTDEQIHQYQKNCNIIFGQNMISIDQLLYELEQLRKLNNMYGSYWQFVYGIYQQIKSIHKTQISTLKYPEIELVITKYQEGYSIIQSAFDPKDPYIKYLGNLKQQIVPLEMYSSLFKQLTQPYLLPEHYNKYQSNFSDSPVKKILDDWQCSPPRQRDLKLITSICEVASKQWQMRQVLQTATEDISKKIEIVQGRFQIQLTCQSLQKIQQKQYLLVQIQASRQLAPKYRQLKQSTVTLKRTIQQLIKLKSILSQFEVRYYNFCKLFKYKYRHLSSQIQSFKLAESMWKEVIQIITTKPIIEQMYTNKYLNHQIIKGNDLIKDIENQLLSIINNLYQECELLRMVNKSDMYKYLVEGDYQNLILKCFNNIHEVTIEQKEIISVGVPGRNNLILQQPVKIETLYPEKWIGQLEEQIKATLLLLIKKHLLDDQYKLKQLPEMVESIILMIKYTKLIQQNVQNQQGLLRILQNIQENNNKSQIITFINRKILQLMQKKQKWSYFPKYYYEQSFIINYKSDYFDFESVYHDTMYMEENKMIACMFGWGYLDLDQEGSITEERNNSLIELAKRKKIIFVGKSNNQGLQVIKKINKPMESIFIQ